MASIVAHVDGAAALERLAAVDGDGAGADGSRGDHGHGLAGTDRVDGRLDGLEVVVAGVDFRAAGSRSVRALRAVDGGIGGSRSALREGTRDQPECSACSEKREACHGWLLSGMKRIEKEKKKVVE